MEALLPITVAKVSLHMNFPVCVCPMNSNGLVPVLGVAVFIGAVWDTLRLGRGAMLHQVEKRARGGAPANSLADLPHALDVGSQLHVPELG